MKPVLQLTHLGEGATRLGTNLWRKELLRFGTWVHPNDPERELVVDRSLVDRIKVNFESRVLDFVPVPSGHSDAWEANRGEVISLEVDPNVGLIALLRVDAETDQAIADGRLRGISAGFHEDYLDRERDVRVGPLLRHAALTNVPYIKGLAAFERVVNDESFDPPFEVLALSEKDQPMLAPTAALPDTPTPAEQAKIDILVRRMRGENGTTQPASEPPESLTLSDQLALSDQATPSERDTVKRLVRDYRRRQAGAPQERHTAEVVQLTDAETDKQSLVPTVAEQARIDDIVARVRRLRFIR